jgi:very-short-patch-repair endonuclease
MDEFVNKYVKADRKQWFFLKERAKAMRKAMTPAESLLWDKIKNNKLGVKFRRQEVIHNYIADFASNSIKLVVELDGSSHNDKTDYDRYRTEIIEILGFKVLRFKSEELFNDINIVIDTIKSEINKSSSSSPSLQGEGFRVG